MKNYYFKKFISLALAFCLIFSALPITIWAVDEVATQSGTATDSYGNTATLAALDNGKFGLSFHFVGTYKDGMTDAGVSSGKNTATDTTRLGGIVKYLLVEAVKDYNSKNNTALTAPALGETAKFTDVNYSVTELTVTSAEGATVDNDLFRSVLPTDGFVNVEKIDMSGMNCPNNKLTYQSGYGIFADQYVIYYVDETSTSTIEGAGQKTSCSYLNLTELILPNSLEIVGTSAIRGLGALTSIVIPDNVTCLEGSSLQRNKNLKKVTLSKNLVYYGTSDNDTTPVSVTESTQTPVNNWTYHGTTLTEASWTQLISDINSNNPVSLDFSDSNITWAQLQTIETTTLEYLDISGCTALEDESGTDYSNVVEYVATMRANGVTVITNIKFNNTYSDTNGNSATLTALDSGKYSLSLHIAQASLKDGTTDAGVSSGRNTATDTTRLGGIVKALLVGAVEKYNANNNTSLSAPALGKTALFTDVNYSITELYVTSADGVTIDIDLFRSILPTDGFVNLTKIDMSGMNCSNNTLVSSETNAGIFSNQLVYYYTDANTETSIEASNNNSVYPHLTELILPNTITTIGQYALRGLANIKELTVPKSVTTLNDLSLAGLSGLTSLKLSSSIANYSSDVLRYGDSPLLVDWSYNGTSLSDEGWTNLLADINIVEPISIDISKSSIIFAQLNTIKTDSLKYIDISGCTALENESGADYDSVVEYVNALRESGVTVITNIGSSVSTSLKTLAQCKTNSSGTSTIRFVSTIDSLNYKAVGFVLSRSNTAPTIGGANCINAQYSVVYKEIWNGGTKLHIDAAKNDTTLGIDASAQYFYTCYVQNIPSSANETPIYVRPYYILKDGSVVYGEAATATVNTATVVE